MREREILRQTKVDVNDVGGSSSSRRRCWSVGAISLILTLAAAGCNRDQPAEGTDRSSAGDREEQSAGPGILWHPGDVDSAFATARDSGKPVFLYWGAEWCPPCQQLKSTVFRERQFIEQSRLFVPVYLDGDGEDAQRQGERFRITGYPTMIVFDSEGVELMRVPGGMNLRQYADVLDLVSGQVRSVGDILQAVLEGAEVSDRDYRQLAYYSWLLDNQTVLGDRDPVATLGTLAERCPARLTVEKGRLFVDYLRVAAFAGPDALDAAARERARLELARRLEDASFVRDNIQFLTVYTAQLAAAVSDVGTRERHDLTAAFVAALDRAADSDTVSKTDRVYAVFGKVALAKSNHPDRPLAPELLQEVKDRAAWADQVTTDPSERVSAIYGTAFLLLTAELYEEAADLARRELDKAPSREKFAEVLAFVAEGEGRHDDAIEWQRRAYRFVSGPASRFEFGVEYVDSLIEHNPDDVAAVEQATVSVLDDLEVLKTAIYGRTKERLQRLDSGLRSWGTGPPERDKVLARLRERARSMCEQIPRDEASRQPCEAFLADRVSTGD